MKLELEQKFLSLQGLPPSVEVEEAFVSSLGESIQSLQELVLELESEL